MREKADRERLFDLSRQGLSAGASRTWTDALCEADIEEIIGVIAMMGPASHETTLESMRESARARIDLRLTERTTSTMKRLNRAAGLLPSVGIGVMRATTRGTRCSVVVAAAVTPRSSQPRFERPNSTSPATPLPRRSAVPGSGTGAER